MFIFPFGLKIGNDGTLKIPVRMRQEEDVGSVRADGAAPVDDGGVLATGAAVEGTVVLTD